MEGFGVIMESEQSEEINAILEDIDNLRLTDWEYDFIMNVAEKEFLSEKQSDIITQIYKKYIDPGEYSG